MKTIIILLGILFIKLNNANDFNGHLKFNKDKILSFSSAIQNFPLCDSVLILDTLFNNKNIRIYWNSCGRMYANFNGLYAIIKSPPFSNYISSKTNEIRDLIIFNEPLNNPKAFIPLDSNIFLFTIEDDIKFEAHLFGVRVSRNKLMFLQNFTRDKTPIVSISHIFLDLNKKIFLINKGLNYNADTGNNPIDTVGKWCFESYSITDSGFVKTKSKALMDKTLKQFTPYIICKYPKKSMTLFNYIYKDWYCKD